MSNSFLSVYRQTVTDCLVNDFSDNWDFRRFGAEKELPSQSIQQNIKQQVKRLLSAIGFYKQPLGKNSVESNIENFEWLYQHLADNESKQILVQVLAYRSLGHRRVKLPLNNPDYWGAIERLERLAVGAESIDLGFNGYRACRMDLASIGYPVKLFYVPFAVIYVFVLQQYRCKMFDVVIEVAEGDTVIDAGACYGDTALYFAHKAGKNGKVYSCEFLPENLTIFNRNMALNAELAGRIKLVEQPLWSKSGEQLFVEGNGPGTRVVSNPNNPDAIPIKTQAIDDLVRNEKLDRVDFIKMDIEGAELEALKGAENTIRQFRPKLAISVYHKFEDFWTIPKYIDSLGLGYRFSLRHFTIHQEETVLFAY